MWSNLAHEMTAEFRGLCAEEVREKAYFWKADRCRFLHILFAHMLNLLNFCYVTCVNTGLFTARAGKVAGRAEQSEDGRRTLG